MKSNFRYFFRQSVIVLLVSVAYGAFLSLVIMEKGDGIEDFISCMLLGFFIMSILYRINLYKREIPMAISFGSTRKNLFLGMMFYDVISLVLMGTILSLAAAIFVPKWDFWGMLRVMTMVLLLSDFLGEAVGMCIYKLGKIAGMIVLIVMSFVGGVAAGFVTKWFGDNHKVFAINNIMLIIFAIILLLWIIAQFIQARILRKYAY